MNIKVLGWYGHGNIGDEAYKIAFPLILPGHNIEFVEELQFGDNPDVVILGGGDVVYPSFTTHLDKIPNSVKKICASVSFTDNSDFSALKKFQKIFVRDYRSSLLADKAGVKSVYLPDFTFVLSGNPQAGRDYVQEAFKEEGHQLHEKFVVCVISNYLAYTKLDMLARDLTSFMKMSQDIAQVADELPISFVFLPFSTKPPWDDRVACSWVADRCKFYDKNIVIWEHLDVQTIINIIAASNACVSSRLHSSIFSTITGTPFIDLTHHTKNLGFIETLERTDWSMPFWGFSIKHYKELLNSFLKQESKDDYLNKFSHLTKERLKTQGIL